MKKGKYKKFYKVGAWILSAALITVSATGTGITGSAVSGDVKLAKSSVALKIKKQNAATKYETKILKKIKRNSNKKVSVFSVPT